MSLIIARKQNRNSRDIDIHIPNLANFQVDCEMEDLVTGQKYQLSGNKISVPPNGNMFLVKLTAVASPGSGTGGIPRMLIGFTQNNAAGKPIPLALVGRANPTRVSAFQTNNSTIYVMQFTLFQAI